jgi:hypothetical protein
MLQCRIWHYTDLGHPKSGQQNTAQVTICIQADSRSGANSSFFLKKITRYNADVYNIHVHSLL